MSRSEKYHRIRFSALLFCLSVAIICGAFTEKSYSQTPPEIRVNSPEFLLPVGLSAEQSITNIDFVISGYDAEVVTPVDVTLAGGILENKNYVSAFFESGGKFRVVIYAAGNIATGKGIVAFVRFRIDGSGHATLPLTVESFQCNDVPVSDGFLSGGSVYKTLSIRVNHTPTAQDDSFSVNENGRLTGTLRAADPDNDALTYVIVAAPKLGTVDLTNASFIYTPQAGVFGTDSFTFKVSDGYADSNTATIRITVSAVNLPPVISVIRDLQTPEETLTLPIAFTVSDPDSPVGSLTVTASSSNELLVPAGNIVITLAGGSGTVQIKPAPYDFKTDSQASAEITLIVSDGQAQSSRKFLLTVYRKPAPKPTIEATEGAVPLFVRFRDASLGAITKWLWDFGDGVVNSLQNPSHTYFTEGVYTVTLTVSGPGGTETIRLDQQITVSKVPIDISFTAAPTEGAAPLTVGFVKTVQGNVTSLRWDFGNDLTSDQENPVHTYTTPGTYTVRLTAAGPAGSKTVEKKDYIRVVTLKTVGGRVTDQNTGAGLSGFTVNVRQNNQIRGTAETDASGGYSISGLYPSKDYIVEAAPPAGSEAYRAQFYQGKILREQADKVSLTEGNRSDIHFAMTPIPNIGVSGRVHDGVGNGVAGVKIKAFSESVRYSKTVTSGADGSYILTGLVPASDYRISAWSDELETAFWYAIPKTETVGAFVPVYSVFYWDEAAPVTPQKPPLQRIDLIVNLHQRGMIEGYVYDRDNGNAPVENIWVNAWSDGLNAGNGAWSDASGRYRIWGLGEVTPEQADAVGYIVQVWPEKFPYQAYDRAVNVENAARVPTGRTDVHFYLPSVFAVEGKATDKLTQKPVAGVQVWAISPAEGKSGTAVTDDQGVYRIGGLTYARDYVIKAVHPDYPVHYYRQKTDLKTADAIGLTGSVFQGADFILDKGDVIQGAVFDASGNPAPDIWVNIWSESTRTGGDVRTDAQGKYFIQGLESGASDYVVSVPESDFQPAYYRDNHDQDGWNDTVYQPSESQGITPSSDVGRNLVLKNRFVIRGMVTFDGAPYAGDDVVGVRAASASGEKKFESVVGANTGEGFNYEIPRLLPGTYTVSLITDSYSGSVPATVVITKTADNIGFDLGRRLPTMSGTVSGLEPDTFIWINAISPRMNVNKIISVRGTGAPVSWQIRGLTESSDYRAEISSVDYMYQVYNGQTQWESADLIDLVGKDAKDIRFTLVPNTSSISGTALFPNGTPVGTAASVFAVGDTPYSGGSADIEYTGAASVPFTVSGIPGTIDGEDGKKRNTYLVFIRSDAFKVQYYNETPEGSDIPGSAVRVDTRTSQAHQIDFALDAGRSVSGRLTGSGAGGVRVEAWSDKIGNGNGTVSEPDGSFVIKGLRHASDYIVKAATPDAAPFFYNRDKTVREQSLAGRVSLAEGDAKDVNIMLSLGGVISGDVRNIIGDPLPRVWISAWSDAMKSGVGCFTDANGFYELRGLPESKDYAVDAKPEPGDVYLPSLKTDVSTGSSADFILRRKEGFTVEGDIKNVHGDYLPNVTVKIWSDSLNFEGTAAVKQIVGQQDLHIVNHYVITGLPEADDYMITAKPDQGSPYAVFSEKGISVHKDLTLDLVMTLAAAISGYVYDSDDLIPIQGASVTAISEMKNFQKDAVTNADGYYDIGNAPDASDYVMIVRADDYADQKFTIRHPSERTDLYVNRQGVISGIVKDKVSGKPIQGVHVSAWSEYYGKIAGYSGTSETDGSGKYIIKNLSSEVSDYIAAAVSPFHAIQMQTGKKIPAALNFLLVNAAEHMIAGTASDADGHPFTGIAIAADIFERAGSDAVFVKSASVNDAGAFAFAGLDPLSDYYFKFMGFDSAGEEIFSRWAVQGATGEYDGSIESPADGSVPADVKSYRAGDQVVVRLSAPAGSGRTFTSGTFRSVRDIRSASHMAIRAENIGSADSDIVSSNPNVVVSWEPSAEGEGEGYYYTFNQEPGFVFDKRDAPRSRPADVRTATSPALTGDDVYFYFHVAPVDPRGRIGETSTMAFRIDTVPPTSLLISVPPAVSSRLITLTLGAAGAFETYISNTGYGEGGAWTTFSMNQEWTLIKGDGKKTIYVQFRDRAKNTSHAMTMTELSSVKHKITATAGENGTISPSGDTEVAQGADQTFTFTPDPGYAVDKVTVDGAIAEITGNQYEFKTVTAPHAIHVTFTQADFIITVYPTQNGTVWPAGEVPVLKGKSITFYLTPDPGFVTDKVYVDDSPVTAENNQFTIVNVEKAHTVVITFKRADFIITVLPAQNGSVTPSGEVSVKSGQNVTFTVTPDEGYMTGAVTVDGKPVVPVNNRFTIENIKDNHTVGVTFKPVPAGTVIVTVKVSGNGKVTPSGEIPVKKGENITLTAIPDAGYGIGSVTAGGKPVSVNPDGTFTIENVAEPVAVQVIFVKTGQTFTVSAAAGTGGNVVPTGDIAVAAGGSQILTVTPDPGFEIAEVLMNGKPVRLKSDNTYEFVGVSQDYRFAVSFKPAVAPVFTITATAGVHGSIFPHGPLPVNSGAGKTFTVVPAEGYAVDAVKVDGKTVILTEGNQWTFSNISADHTIHATFRPAEP